MEKELTRKRTTRKALEVIRFMGSLLSLKLFLVRFDRCSPVPDKREVSKEEFEFDAGVTRFSVHLTHGVLPGVQMFSPADGQVRSPN